MAEAPDDDRIIGLIDQASKGGRHTTRADNEVGIKAKYMVHFEYS